MPNIAHGCGVSDHCFYRIVKDTGTLPEVISQALLDSSRIGHFPYSSNSEMSVSIPLKEKKKEKKIMHNFLSNT